MPNDPIEESLRQMFTARVAGLPLPDDPATVAVRRGRAARRQRLASSTVAAGLIFIVVLAGTVYVQSLAPGAGGSPGEAPVLGAADAGPAATDLGGSTADRAAAGDRPAAEADGGMALAVPSEALPVLSIDRWAGRELWTVDGQRLTFDAAPADEVRRVPSGWLYGADRRLRQLHSSGDRELATGVSAWAVSQDGVRVAYVAGRLLRLRRLTDAGLTSAGLAGSSQAIRGGLSVSDGVVPVAFAADWVVISTGATGPYDVLRPTAPYRPTWNHSIVAIYGARGEDVIGLVREPGRDELCLARLRPTVKGLLTWRTGGCGLGLRPGVAAVLGPDGAWLAEPGADGVRLIHVDRALADSAPVTVGCAVRATARPVWIDASTVVTADAQGAVLCRTDGSMSTLELPAVDGGWRFVPRTGPQPAG